jgi:2-phosphosulfolactate phosphatase
MNGSVAISCFPESALRYLDGYAIVAVDVIRATTTAVTAVSLGWRCFPTPSLEAAVSLAATLDRPLLVGELGGNMPFGFDMTNSPAGLLDRTDTHRPMILLSTAGTSLIHLSQGCEACYVACLRNFSAQVSYLVGRHPRVAVIGAGSRGEFREEDQLCCAWIAEGLIKRGYEPANEDTATLVERWSGAPPDSFTGGNSVKYLERSGQLSDLDFILSHIDDLQAVFLFQGNEIAMVRTDLNTSDLPVSAYGPRC